MRLSWTLILWVPGFLIAQPDTSRTLLPAEVQAISPEAEQGLSLAEKALSLPENPLLLSTTENLNLAPGLAAFDGTAGTAKFSFRGMGARTQFTTSRSLVYLDQIPLTSMQGFSSFEDLNPLWLPQMQLREQPHPAYPLALGGVLQYDLRQNLPGGPLEASGVYTELNFGSFGYLQSNSLARVAGDDFFATAGYENTSQEGWRENNRLQRQSVFANAQWQLSQRYRLQWLLYGLQNRVEIPSSLNRQDFEENPEMAAESWGRTRGFKEYDRLVTGLSLEGGTPGQTTYRLTAFYRFIDNFEPRPFNILTEKRHGGGVRYQLSRNLHQWGDFNFHGEYQVGWEDVATFENRYDSSAQSYNHPGENLEQNLLLGQRFNGGLMWRKRLGKDCDSTGCWSLQVGVQAMYQHNRIPNEELSFDLPWQWAPALVLRQAPGPKGFSPVFKFYRSYSVPSLEENLDPDGRLNRGLKPELAWTGEAGFSWNFLPELEAQVQYYYTEVENLIVPRVVGPDQVVATNSGRSRHTGLEMILAYHPVAKGTAGWQPRAMLSGYYGYFGYLNFSDTAGSFSGNRLPGFPEGQLSGVLGLTYRNTARPQNRHEPGSAGKKWFKCHLGLLARYTTGYFVNDENTVATDPYFLLQSWLRLEREWLPGLMASLTLGVKNLTDMHYASMTVVNNQAFGGAPPRYFYPGTPLNFYGSVGVGYYF